MEGYHSSRAAKATSRSRTRLQSSVGGRPFGGATLDYIIDKRDNMRSFELIIKLRATEGQRVHKAYIGAADEAIVIDMIRENLDGRFFAIRSHVGGMLTPENSYPVIINTAEVLDIMIIDRGEMEQA